MTECENCKKLKTAICDFMLAANEVAREPTSENVADAIKAELRVRQLVQE